MIYTELTKKAMKLCFEAHKEQKDKSGLPYVFHPFHLAEQMKDEHTTVVALLHDVVEDTEVTLDDLRKEFPADVVDAIALMTHDDNEDYMSYVARIKQNSIAKAVKIADLTHNSDTTRLDTVTDKDIQRVQKYRKALELLNN
ncbi:MAG: bifunctional (p)ppGpp synthetase/guanosine-3',5'-bis(diphosphate) 3'-pyrophosphohydrolase [Erysipelotrichaceae bacterium]|nr:bifunctional (p)ppGpp synthetase/guanosine-3',5'-bis(diphosphate) 3'-pyrophosphohydrolase [Erysipelotrichaceae bacterium]